jgi:hypothetical protein
MRLEAYGIAIDLPRGWDGRVYRRPGAEPTLHAANFELPRSDGDFGSGATARMPDRGIFIALKAYTPGPRLRPGFGLYASHSIPLPLREGYFDPRALQVGRPGQAGFQHFFTGSGRPFCLYAVIRHTTVQATRAGGQAPTHAHGQVGQLSRVLSSLAIARQRQAGS